jgi:hypothetical protein
MSKPRPFAAGDIVEISYLHLPVAKHLGDMAKFSCRIVKLEPVSDYDPNFAMICPSDDIDRKHWQILHWEQKSANKKGMIVLSAEGQTISHLPRVRFVRRPK